VEDKDKEKFDLNEEDLEKEITENIKNISSLLFYVTHEGEVIMISTSEMTTIQKNIATKMLVVAGSHSLILRIVLGLEILFEKIMYRISGWFKPRST